MELGIRARGVVPDGGRPLPNPRPDSFDDVRAFGVVNGERVGEVPIMDVFGDERAGLLLGEPRLTREFARSFAVKAASFDARDTGATLDGDGPGGLFASLGFAAGVVAVLLVGRNDGVTRPVPAPGVTRPLEYDEEEVRDEWNVEVWDAEGVRPAYEGVILPEDMAGVTLPLRLVVTDGGRPTVGGDSFVTATKTPHAGRHAK